MARQRGYIGEVRMGRRSLAIERHRNVARVLPKPSEFLEHKKRGDTSHIPRGGDITPPRPRGLPHGSKGVGPRGSLGYKDVQQFPLADVHRGGGRGEQESTRRDNKVLGMNRIVADPRRWRDAETDSSVTELLVWPTSRGPTAMAMLVYQAIMYQIAVKALQPVRSSKCGLRGM